MWRAPGAHTLTVAGGRSGLQQRGYKGALPWLLQFSSLWSLARGPRSSPLPPPAPLARDATACPCGGAPSFPNFEQHALPRSLWVYT